MAADDCVREDDFVSLPMSGPFTRVNPADPSDKSCIDLLICSVGLRPYIQSLLIDSNGKYAMKRPVIVKGRAKLIFTDHFTIILRMKNIPLAGRTKEKVVGWNLQKEGDHL